jgi:hypothetical protein
MGASIFAGALLPFLLYLTIIFFTVYYSIIIRYEESFLNDNFGEKYKSYLNNVPRFFPRLSAYSGRGNAKPNFSKGFGDEKSTFVTIISFIVLVLISWYLQS